MVSVWKMIQKWDKESDKFVLFYWDRVHVRFPGYSHSHCHWLWETADLILCSHFKRSEIQLEPFRDASTLLSKNSVRNYEEVLWWNFNKQGVPSTCPRGREMMQLPKSWEHAGKFPSALIFILSRLTVFREGVGKITLIDGKDDGGMR